MLVRMQSPVIANDIETFSIMKENHYFDRKSSRIAPEDLARHICAFANAGGVASLSSGLRTTAS